MHQYLDKKIMLPLHRHNFFPRFWCHNIFFLILTKIQGIPSGIPENFWEFTKNSWEFPEILGNSHIFNKKIKCPLHNFFIFRATVTHIFFSLWTSAKIQSEKVNNTSEYFMIPKRSDIKYHSQCCINILDFVARSP